MTTGKNPASWRGMALVLLAGMTARLLAAAHGHNYDMNSYFIVANITAAGGNVYAETERYNYGPVWFLILHALDLIARHHETVLRWLVAGFLSLADAGIARLLYRQAGWRAATLFFLNPISILVTGYQSQFDNFALWLGLTGVLRINEKPEAPLTRRDFEGLLLLGLSLATKHDLFLFPLWLAAKRRGWFQKFLVLAVPAAVALAAFLPWWPGSQGGILRNVFGYHPGNHAVFYHVLLPGLAQTFLSAQGCCFLFLILFAFICRTRDNFHSLLLYTGVLVATSPAAGNQYLAIPAALAAVCVNPFFIGYYLLGGFHICVDNTGLSLRPDVFSYLYNDLAICSLCAALVWALWPEPFARLAGKIRREIRVQLGRDE